MSARNIVPVEPANGGDTVVIEVLQEGSHPLDVRLVGCEGETPYVTSIKHRNLGALKHKFKGSDHEWATIVSHFLLQQQPEVGEAALLDGIRMVYTLKNKSLELSFRKDVQNIKVTLGEIILPEDDEFEFNPFEWAQVSAVAHAQTLKQMVDLEAQVKSKQQTIAKLNAQLEDFIKTKHETETAMLQQFMQLLNEKKRKIRDQSRLLAGVKVDKPTTAAVQSSRANTKAADTKTRRAGASRTSKRKAPAQSAEPDVVPKSDSDQMEIDQAKAEEQSNDEMPEPMTPEQSDNETDVEDEPAPTATARSSQTLRSTSVAHSSKSEATESKGVPPPRALPFVKRTGMPTRSRDVTAADDDDDETDDEEL
ncbi:hypothetical protein J4E82_002987 [Alternaria postmessia]|uniref:uncharacterized protein n=1 Tax=Alternaria postmessia TaxID=1187938 RepID=UPI0010E6178E|nr:uncharacterized protein J4E82_002987 [Alternaria postmessia]KAI5378291.1 hypothetical protein J4E82_002987 [Alternaria postmessia]RYN96481.1 hypothetical protein AA0120_g2830 [Alternaria tenuissima]